MIRRTAPHSHPNMGGGKPGPKGDKGDPGTPADPGLYPYDLIAFFPDVPSPGEKMWSFIADRQINFPANLLGSKAGSDSVAGTPVVLGLLKNADLVGEIFFDPASITGAFSNCPALQLTLGDQLSLVAQASPCGLLSGIKVTLCGSRAPAGESGTVGGVAGEKGDPGVTGFTAVASGTLEKGMGVYWTADGKVAAGDCTDLTKSNIVGIVTTGALDGALATINGTSAVAQYALGGTGVPGSLYYLGPTGAPILWDDVPAHARIVQLGVASTTWHLSIALLDIGRRA